MDFADEKNWKEIRKEKPKRDGFTQAFLEAARAEAQRVHDMFRSNQPGPYTIGPFTVIQNMR